MIKYLGLIFLLVNNMASQCQQLDFKGTAALVQRRISWLSSKVDFKQLKNTNKEDVFRLQTKNNRLIVEASSLPAAAMAINHYLHFYCNQSFTLYTDNIKPLRKLPIIDGVCEKRTPFSIRHANYHCTLNYTQAFWKWDDWSRCIDWYALNGVNLMLTLVGAEAVEQEVLKKFGYSFPEIQKVIPTPAYTSWHWLGNVEAVGTAITENLIEKQKKLQQNILARLDQLGIEPMMQGFCGLVPANFRDKFPQAHILDQGDWAWHKRPMFLETTDTLFNQYADAWYSASKKFFGKRKFFTCDILHEGGLSKEMNFKQLVPDIQNAMIRHNENAVWVVQAWFIQADDYPKRDSTNNGNPYPPLLEAAIKKHILIWEIYGENDNIWERRKGFGDLNFIWGTLTYFGARNGLVGKLDRYVNEVTRAYKKYPEQLQGIGTNPEAVDNNPIWYDFIYSLAWNLNVDSSINIDSWLNNYSTYRYGKNSPQLKKAWELIHKTALSSYKQVSQGAPNTIFCVEPNYMDSLNGKSNNKNLNKAWRNFRAPFYDVAEFEQAAKLFVSVADDFKKSPTYLYDLVDITRQVLSNRGNSIFDSLMQSYKRKDIVEYDIQVKKFLSTLDQMEILCNSHPLFRVHQWLDKARKMGDTPAEKILLETSAKSLITNWAIGISSPEINDYSQRQWAGLLKDYYKKRWVVFLDKCRKEISGASITKINWAKFADDWIAEKNNYTDLPKGNSIEIAKACLYNTFANSLK